MPPFGFVILHHTRVMDGGRGDHWDWFLDWPGRLRNTANRDTERNENVSGQLDSSGLISFASVRDPREGWIGNLLQRLPPHRARYLEYEGDIGGGRGEVRRVAVGAVAWESIESYRLAFRLTEMEFAEPSSPVWPAASYCLAHTGARLGPDVEPNLQPWYSSRSDTEPHWQLSRLG